MAANGIITKGLAYHYRDELAKGQRRGGGFLTDEDIEMRMSALQARAETLGATFRVRELRTIEELKSKVLARMDVLQERAEAQHREAMETGARQHDEVQEHIAGVPGDMFLREHLHQPGLNKVRIAKEFTKFTERCFIRLLGDMRSVNYVVDITPDFEEVQYRVRPIDFDQQSYEGKGNTYLAFRFSSNRQVTRLAFEVLNRKTIDQYVAEEHAQMARRAKVESLRLRALLGVMSRDELAPPAHVESLARALGKMHGGTDFSGCATMGELTARHITLMLGV
jgi:hypothetical protein